MAKNKRSIALDEEMEKELKVMVVLGLKLAPIMASTLHERMKDKCIVKGKVSTFSPSDRVTLIEKYRLIQLGQADIEDTEEKANYGTVAYYKSRNQKLNAALDDKKSQLSKNVGLLAAFVQHVESTTPIKIEELLYPELSRDGIFNPLSVANPPNNNYDEDITF